MLGPKLNVAQARYRDFLQEVVPAASPCEALQGQVILGGEGFVEKFKNLISDKENFREIPRQQSYLGRPSLEKLFQMNDSKISRDRCIYEGDVKYGYTLKEIGDHLKIRYSAVSKVISRTANPTRAELAGHILYVTV
ncbi:MAG: hypothetical protein ACLQPD_05960 [Desulfomonilaceae bacterium]